MLTRKLPLLHTLSRTYATTSPSHDHWPTPPSSFHKHPTPYQILNHDPSAAYTKSQFISLVKLYHPDFKSHPYRSSNVQTDYPQASLSDAVKLDRYRLIVAAHSLLSDPVKRAAYDTHGIGWLDGLEDSVLQKAAAAGGKAAHSSRGNATWEDWERWRFEQEEFATGAKKKTPSEPVYMRNGQFASLLIVLTVLAGAAQTVHAENLTEASRLVREERHYQATQDLKKSQEVARKLGREQRIQEFVRARDPAVLKNPGLMGLVIDPDICESGTEDGKRKELDMRRKFKK